MQSTRVSQTGVKLWENEANLPAETDARGLRRRAVPMPGPAVGEGTG